MKSEWFEWDEKINDNDKMQIYPILVVGNRVFKTPGISPILNNLLRESLKKNNIYGCNIHDLLLIDIDTLIWFQYDFKEGYIDFQDAVEKYYKFIKANKPYKPHKESLFVNFIHNTFSFSDYLLDFYEHKANNELVDEITTGLKSLATANVRNIIKDDLIVLNN